MKIEVGKYRKPDGYVRCYWSVMVDGELLAVTLYRKGAEAIARAITSSNPDPNVTTLQDSSKPVAKPVAKPCKSTAGMAKIQILPIHPTLCIALEPLPNQTERTHFKRPQKESINLTKNWQENGDRFNF